jgi:hypothetical protein
MANLKQDIVEAAEQIARALRSSNYRANFSPESLWDIDLFFDDHSADGVPKPKGLLATQLGSRMFAIGGYVGETIRRKMGGEWQADDADPQGEINISVKLSDGNVIWPVQRVMKRLKNGAEDGIAVYGSGLGLPVGPRTTPFSQFRGQPIENAQPVLDDVALIAQQHEARERSKSTRRNNIFDGIMLFFGSAFCYSLLVLLIASFMDRRVRIPPTLFLMVACALVWGGVKLCSAWRLVCGCIWLAFSLLAICNSFYYVHLQKNPLIQTKEGAIQYLTVMTRSTQIMIAVTLLVGVLMLMFHRRAKAADA